MTRARTAVPPSRFRLEAYFLGTTRAKGIFQDRFGTLRRQFDVAIEGRWDGRTLTLVEEFAYDDVEAERRVRRIGPVGANGYRGQADGVVGTATDTPIRCFIDPRPGRAQRNPAWHGRHPAGVRPMALPSQRPANCSDKSWRPFSCFRKQTVAAPSIRRHTDATMTRAAGLSGP